MGTNLRTMDTSDQWIVDASTGEVVGVQTAGQARMLAVPGANPVGAQVDPVTGGIDFSVAGTVVPVPKKQPVARVIKQFSDLVGVTIGTSNATVVSSIDPDSPFGCPALKLVCTFSTTAGRVEVTPQALGIASFNGHVGYSVWFDDTTKVGQASVFVGTSGFSLYNQVNHVMFGGVDLVGGHRVVVAGPTRKNNVVDGGFVFGTSTLQATKLRIFSPNPIGGTATVWVKDCFIPAPQRPIVCFTWDDGFDSWATKVAPILAANNVKGTFGVNTAQIGSTITAANLTALVAAGHQVCGHNVNNNKLRQLFGTGNGVSNGTGSAQTMTAYMTDYLTGQAALSAYVGGGGVGDFCYHPWVQGGCDTASAEAAKGLGISLARTTSPYETQQYGFALGNNALAIRAVDLSNTRTLAQAKAMIDDAKVYGGLCVFMGHETAATASDSVTWAESDLAELVAYAAADSSIDKLTMAELRDRLLAIGAIDPPGGYSSPSPVRCIGQLIGANFNSTADQTITLDSGQWKIEGVYVSGASLSLTTASGGVYTSAAKGGTAIVAAGQAYSSLTTSTDTLSATMAATPTVTGNIYLSLTTAQGAAATASVFVFGRPV